MFDLLRGGRGPADLATGGFGDRTGMGGALGGERSLHLGEQREEQEADASQALAGGSMGSGSASDRTPMPRSAVRARD